ncbi:MAG: protein kinase domain-containing protein [Nannocystales bacterium]
MDGTSLAPATTAEPVKDGESRIGDVLDRRYRIDALIGEGGMAHVYKITHTMIGKSLAAKVVRHELRNDEEVIRRFLREAQIVSSIKHPNVVDISDYGETPDGGAFCVMELLRGQTLAEAIDSKGAFSAETALGVALQICQGLDHSHETGVVHRDLKPQNIFICDPKNGKEPVVKLIDFGVARAGNRITVAGAVLGTPEYMSPEQVRGDSVDAGADLYALGIILFELLTAAVPYRSDDVAVTMQSQLHGPTPKMTLVNPDLAGLVQTQALIERLMAKVRADRPGNAAEVAVLLQQAFAADLGQETAERVVKSTLNIGSGGIVQTPSLPPPPTKPWADGQMPWNPETQSSAQPAEPPPSAVPPADTSDLEFAARVPTRGSPVPWVVAATALLVSAGTIGAYSMSGGFQRHAPASTSRDEAEAEAAAEAEIEIVAAPVPEDPEDAAALQVQKASPGGKSEGVEQTPPGGASVLPEGGPDKPDSSTATAEIPGETPPQTADPEGKPHTARKRSPRRPGSDPRKPSKPREKKATGTDETPKPASTSKPAEPPKPPPPPAKPTHDGDLRNPFG